MGHCEEKCGAAAEHFDEAIPCFKRGLLRKNSPLRFEFLLAMTDLIIDSHSDST